MRTIGTKIRSYACPAYAYAAIPAPGKTPPAPQPTAHTGFRPLKRHPSWYPRGANAPHAHDESKYMDVQDIIAQVSAALADAPEKLQGLVSDPKGTISPTPPRSSRASSPTPRAPSRSSPATSSATSTPPRSSTVSRATSPRAASTLVASTWAASPRTSRARSRTARSAASPTPSAASSARSRTRRTRARPHFSAFHGFRPALTARTHPVRAVAHLLGALADIARVDART